MDRHAHCGPCGARFPEGLAFPRRCAACGHVTYVNPVPVAVLLLPVDDGLLVIRRAIEPRKGQLALPGGFIDLGESWQAAAARELREETGHEAAALRLLGVVRPNPAILTNRCHTFLATGCRRVGDLEQDPGEDMELLAVPLAEVDTMVRRGEIDHALVLAALHFLRLGTSGAGPGLPPAQST